MKYKNEKQDSADHPVKFAFVDLSAGDEPSCCDNGLSQHGV